MPLKQKQICLPLLFEKKDALSIVNDGKAVVTLTEFTSYILRFVNLEPTSLTKA